MNNSSTFLSLIAAIGLLAFLFFSPVTSSVSNSNLNNEHTRTTNPFQRKTETNSAGNSNAINNGNNFGNAKNSNQTKTTTNKNQKSAKEKLLNAPKKTNATLPTSKKKIETNSAAKNTTMQNNTVPNTKNKNANELRKKELEKLNAERDSTMKAIDSIRANQKKSIVDSTVKKVNEALNNTKTKVKKSFPQKAQ